MSFNGEADVSMLIFGDFTTLGTEGSCGGRVFVGGSFHGTRFDIAKDLPAADGEVDALKVKEQLVVQMGNINGNVRYSSTTTGGLLLTVPDNSDIIQGDANYDFEAAKNYYTGLSGQLQALPSTGRITGGTVPGSGITFKGTNADLEVFDINCVELENKVELLGSIFLTDVKEGATVLINSDGPIDCGLVMAVPGSQMRGFDPARTLWNFHEATKVNIACTSGEPFQGSILAPHATVLANFGQVDGDVVSQSWSGQVPVSHEPFRGCFTDSDDSDADETTEVLVKKHPSHHSNSTSHSSHHHSHSHSVDAKEPTAKKDNVVAVAVEEGEAAVADEAIEEEVEEEEQEVSAEELQAQDKRVASAAKQASAAQKKADAAAKALEAAEEEFALAEAAEKKKRMAQRKKGKRRGKKSGGGSAAKFAKRHAGLLHN